MLLHRIFLVLEGRQVGSFLPSVYYLKLIGELTHYVSRHETLSFYLLCVLPLKLL